MARKKKIADEAVEKEVKPSKLSVNDMDKIMAELDPNEKVVEWHGLEVRIKKMLSLTDMMSFVRDVTSSCFAKDTHEFIPEIRDFAIRMNVMEMYANFKLPTNLVKRYDVVMRSGAFEMIMEHIDAAQYCSIIGAIDKKIANMAEANVEMVHAKLNDLILNFNKLYETLNSVYSGVTQEDIKNIAEAFKGSKFTDEGLVKAFMDQKAKAE